MDKEFEVLEYISKEETITQRKLAQKTGLSLGASNILIKRLIKKGLIKVEQINSRSLKYILTPAGIVEKTKRTYDFIVYSYKYIGSLNNKIKDILLNKGSLQNLYVFGRNDEVRDIIFSAIHEMGFQGEELSIELICEGLYPKEPCLVFVWDIEQSFILRDKGIRYINVLEVLNFFL